MILTTTLLLIITTILIYSHIQISTYTNNLNHSINIANQPSFKSFISEQNDTYHSFMIYQSNKEHFIWKIIWQPINIITIITIIIAILNPTLQLTHIIPLLIATSITPVITFKLPFWLQDWFNITYTHLYLQSLEQINTKLLLIKQQLIQYHNISPNHPNIPTLTQEALTLISLSKSINDQITNLGGQ